MNKTAAATRIATRLMAERPTDWGFHIVNATVQEVRDQFGYLDPGEERQVRHAARVVAEGL